MSTAVEFLRQEIARREAEIAALRQAYAILSGGDDPHKADPPKPQLQLPAPARKTGSKEGKGKDGKTSSRGIYEINGHELSLGPKQFLLLDAVATAEDCVPMDELVAIFGGNRDYVMTGIWALNKKLRAAGAEIVRFDGHGYRLQNIEGEPQA